MFRISKKNLIYSGGFFGFLLLLFILTPLLRNPALNILKYPIGLLNLVGREIGGIIFYHRNLVQSDSLRKEVGLLKERLSQVNEVYLENQRLNEILGFKQASSYKLAAVKVIARAPDNWSSLIIVDKGKRYGIKRGMVAITHLGLVGRVVEAQDSTSKILLIKDTNLSVSAMVQRSRQEGLVCGTLGNFLIMKYLPKDADIKNSDVIITSGLTEAYPKGIIIGSVVEVGQEYGGLTSYAVIKPAVNLSSLEEALIIIP